ncbi:MmyB family transcriptional regulator [Streptomyces clavifer]|uniref:MmyB family transcriptional regulator n=1 Tax=Streptomyces clavifer TaxID=68188 RepID=UPI003663F8B1
MPDDWQPACLCAAAPSPPTSTGCNDVPPHGPSPTIRLVHALARQLSAVVGELPVCSAEFRRLWARHHMALRIGGQTLLDHARAGETEPDHEKLAIAGTDGQVRVDSSPPRAAARPRRRTSPEVTRWQPPSVRRSGHHPWRPLAPAPPALHTVSDRFLFVVAPGVV